MHYVQEWPTSFWSPLQLSFASTVDRVNHNTAVCGNTQDVYA